MSRITLKNFSWGIGGFIVTYQALFLISLPFYLYYSPPSWGILLGACIILALSTLGISVYHRHYSHCGYKLNPWIEPILLIFGTIAIQGSVIMWAHDHRKHHAYIDSDRDPYSVSKGFWHAHILWMLEKPAERDFKRYVPDLLKNKLLVFQDKYYIQLAILLNVIVVIIVGALTHDYLGSFMIVGWGRIFVAHHVTWFVNSLAHYWGERTYSKELSAVDNYLLAFFTGGEGYHNYHHSFPADYRNGVRWYHFDPNKWFVWTLSKLGLAYDLRRHTYYTIREKLLKSDENLFLTTLKANAASHRQDLEVRVRMLSASLQEKLAHVKVLADERRVAFKSRKQQLSRELHDLKKIIRVEWREWHKLGRVVLANRTSYH